MPLMCHDSFAYHDKHLVVEICYTSTMIYIQCALLAEAAFLIDTYQLGKIDDEYFTIFANEKMSVIISGIGKVQAAIATTYLLQKYRPNQEDKIYNLGIATSTQEAIMIGSLHRVNKLIDQASAKVYHLAGTGEALSCVEKALTSPKGIKTPLADMESVGFYLSAKHFISKEQISIIKIVSDKTDTTILPTAAIKALFYKHSKTLGALLS